MHIGIDGLLLHGTYSGVEQAIYRLLGELSRDGGLHRYTLYVPRDFGSDELKREGFALSRVGFSGARRLRRVVWTHLRLAGVARRQGVELLHGPGYLLPRGWSGPAVLTVYDLIALTHPHLCTRANALYYRWALPRSVAAASRVIVPSEFVKRELLERLRIPPEKVRVAPLGVGAEFEPASADAVQAICRRYGIAQPYLLCVGNLEPKKNLAATVRAFGLAKQTGGLPHQLVLAGGKSWGSVDIEREAAALPADTLRRIGYVAPEDLPALYSGAEALLFWSLVEGFGLPALEAMACGTPVVCSDRGALPEVVREAALVVPVGEAEALAAAIRRVTADGALRTQLVADGRRRAAEFTWRGHADAVLAAYAELDSGVR